MAKLLKLRRGTTSQHNTFTGAEGEVTIDTTKDTAVVHDGAQAGGRPLAREDMSNVSSSSIAGRLGADSIATTKIAGGALPTDVTVTNANVVANAAIGLSKLATGALPTGITVASANLVDGTIVNADVNASAAIAGTKISPSFGSQNIATSGHVDLEDSSVVKLGTDDDFQLSYDNGNNQALISMASGKRLKLKCDSIHINNAADNSNILLGDISGSVSLFHGTSEKFKTQSGGAQVTGNLAVTGTVDGRDVASDGSKLDGIESGATADQTASEIKTLYESNSDTNVFTDDDHSKLAGIESNAKDDQTASEILTLIKTVDGAGSGLDADTLDGVNSTSFLRSDAADSASQDITFNGGGGAVTIGGGSDIRLSAGNWTGEASAKIQHHSNHLYLQYPDAGTFRVRDSAGNDNFTVDSSGNATAVGNVTAYSDARLKTDISSINDALGIVGKLRGVSYKWLRDGTEGIGVIAQEVEAVIPSVVVTNEVPGLDGMEEVKSVDYGKIVGVLINAINELKAEVDELKGGK